MKTILLIIVICLVVVAIKNKSKRMEQEKKARDYCERMDKSRQEWMAKKRKELIVNRNLHLNAMVEENKQYGAWWHDIEKEMKEYDKRHLKEWREYNITPPTFAKRDL